MGRRRHANIFFEKDLSQYLEGLLGEIKAAVAGETAEYLLNVDEEEYAQHLVSRYQIEPLRIHFDDKYVTTQEEQIPAERHPRTSFIIRRGESYPRQVIRYHIPYEGTEDLIYCKPNPSILNTHQVELEEGCICFDVIDFYGDPDRIKGDAEYVLKIIRGQSDNVTKNVEVYNQQLLGLIRQEITRRREQLGKQIDIATSLGVPVRKSEHIPETFRIPEVRHKVMPKPSVTEGGGKPEPAIGDDIYQAILQVIHETGKVFERLPSTYAGKDEEALRDHLILQLEPHFEGSTTGETFNKSGKTDILIRFEKSNVFVAECQWWDGSKKHIDKIDQLLSYLTWRDSKTAIICFVNRKDFSNTLRQIVETTQQHSCHIQYTGRKDETWHNFIFHLPGDPDRKIRVAVLAFHLPIEK